MFGAYRLVWKHVCLLCESRCVKAGVCVCVIPFMRVCSQRSIPSVVQGLEVWAAWLHHRQLLFLSPSPSLSLPLPPFLSSFSLSALSPFLPHRSGRFFSLYRSKPPTTLPSVLHKTQGSAHRWFVFTDYFLTVPAARFAALSLFCLLVMLSSIFSFIWHAMQ